MKGSPSLVVFDIAGTLIHDSTRTLDAYRSVLDREGLPIDVDWIQARIGCSKVSVFEELLRREGRDDVDAQVLARWFAESFESSLASIPPEPFSGVDPLFARLRRDGVGIALVTGFDASTAECIRSSCGWSVDAVVGSDQVPRGRPAPDLVVEAMRRTSVGDVAEVAVVGDTPRDLRMAHAAGCGWNIGVATGASSMDELLGHPHTHLLESLEEMSQVLEPDR
ncbi:MAG: HAD hydrolase-like protein [Phycisphaerales bacterium]|nr:HAD hydrolase-like protein [Phycisphaerales bacterium]